MKSKEQEIASLKRSIHIEERHLKNLDQPEYVAKFVRNTKRETRAFINILKSKLNELKKETKENK